MSQNSRNEIQRALNYLGKRFGIEEEDLERYSLKQKSGDIWIVSDAMETELEVETYGIRFLRSTGRGLKPTTYGLQLLGEKLEKNIVEVDREELLQLLRREEMIERNLKEEGYVAIKYEDRIIGCGMYKDGVVSSRVPKGRGKELAESLD